MKIKENIKKSVKNGIANFCIITNSSGISLIVLVITIIVIIILATDIILTLTSINPISEANKARYESDRDNMQSIFTNTATKVMAQKQSSIKIKAGNLNNVTNGESSVVGEAEYEIENIESNSNITGKIIFDNKDNTDTDYYTGKKLPIYKSGETLWSVDEEGILKLQVGKIEINEGGNDNNSKNEENKDNVVISNEEYNNLLKRIENLERQSRNIQRVNLMNTPVTTPLTTAWLEKNFTDINLKDSIGNYKYIEVNFDIYSSGTIGYSCEETKFFAVDNLKYNNTNTINWNNESVILLINGGTTHFYHIGGWFKNDRLLHVGFAQTNDSRENYEFRIKSIYGIN